MREVHERRTIDVDSLQRRLTVDAVARYYGFALPEGFGASGEQRMRCPCLDCTGHDDDRSVSINVSDPFKRWKCFRGNYGCGALGNLVTLAYCLKHGKMPPGGKATGREFFQVAEDLEAIAEGRAAPASATAPVVKETRESVAAILEKRPNLPLGESENEGARKLVELDRQFVVELDALSPAASRYARRRPFFTLGLCQECRTGYIPSSSKSTLRGSWVFGVMNEQGQPLAWVGRNVKYEEEVAAWEAAGRRGDEPTKYRFPTAKLFRRGLELYGVEWLADPRFAESLARHGLLVVEGFTDRLRLHDLGVASVAIMSNRITAEQTEKLIDLAHRYAAGRIGVFLDADEQGDDGAKDLLWKLHERGAASRLVWSRRSHGAQYKDRQPESLTAEEWAALTAEPNLPSR